MVKNYVDTIKPLSRGLPKTGQEVSYELRDDGAIEAGWWLGRLNANNLTRFLVKTINGDDVVIDLATGLMWGRDGDAGGCGEGTKKDWGLAIDWFLDLTFAGFSDWRLPNINELFSIVNWSVYNPAAWDSFTNLKYDNYTWSSTTRAYSTAYAKAIGFSEGSLVSDNKTALNYLRGVRGGI